MTTEDEALEATRDGLRAAGITLDAEGRVVPVSGVLADIAEAGGGVLDAETALDLSVRAEAGESAILSLARMLVASGSLTKEHPPMADLVWGAFQSDAMRVLSRAVPQFIYGLSTEDVTKAAAPLIEFRKAQQETGDES